jgi:hypothetical protein
MERGARRIVVATAPILYRGLWFSPGKNPRQKELVVATFAFVQFDGYLGAGMKRGQKQRISASLSAGLLGLLAVCLASGASAPKDRKEDPMVKTLDAPVDRVYSAAARVASADYTLKSAFKDAYTVNFITGGKFSFFASAICQDRGSGGTIVTLLVTQAEGNPQLLFVNREKLKLAKRFWEQLEAALKVN